MFTESGAMKICFLSSLYSNKEMGGGVPPYISNLSRALARRGHTITIVTSGRPGSIYKEGPVAVVCAGTTQIFSKTLHLLDPVRLWQRLYFMLNAAIYIMRNDFDLVEVPDAGFEHLLLNFHRHFPVVVKMHSDVTEHRQLRMRPIFNFAEKVTLMTADGLSALSNSSADYFAEKYSIPRNSISVIPLGIEPDTHLCATDVKAKYGLNNRKVVLYVGRLDRRKGIETLKILASKMTVRNEIKFVVIGSNLEGFDIETLSPNILYLGRLSKDELFSFYRECDLFFHPSKFETFGLSILEAMLCGRPILAADAVGTRDLVTDGKNGYLFNMADTGDLIDKFNRLMGDPELRERFGRESLSMAKQYDIKNIAKRTEEFFLEVICAWKRKRK